MGRVYDSAMGFAVEAVRLALADAGLERRALDGVLLNPGLAWNDAAMGSFALQQALGLRNLRLSATMNVGGATAARWSSTRRRRSTRAWRRPSPASSRTRR